MYLNVFKWYSQIAGTTEIISLPHSFELLLVLTMPVVSIDTIKHRYIYVQLCLVTSSKRESDFQFRPASSVYNAFVLMAIEKDTHIL